jgi:transposase-like protein
MTITRFCPICKQPRAVDVEDFIKSGKQKVVCGHCNNGVIMTKAEAYDIVYGCCS